MIGGVYFAACWPAGMPILYVNPFLPWFMLSSNQPVGWRIQQV